MPGRESSLIVPPHVEIVPAISEAKFAAGQLVADGQYELQELLHVNGYAGYAEVHRAMDLNSDGHAVSMKIFHELDAQTRQDVDKELAAHALLDGAPGIVGTHDIATLQAGTAHRYVATDFHNGGDLLQRTKERPRDVTLALHMAMQIMPGVEAMHNMDLIHNDIKPGNVLLSQAGQAGDEASTKYSLTDFGLVEAVAPNELLANVGSIAIWESRPETLRGTFPYIAAERFSQEGGTEADIFAAGVMLYYVMTGKLPFNSEPHKHFFSITQEAPVSARSLNAAVPLELDMLNRDCLRPDPADRPTATETKNAIRRIAEMHLPDAILASVENPEPEHGPEAQTLAISY